MPELPEVETIRRHLAPHVRGPRAARGCEVLDARWCRRSRRDELAAAVEGRAIERLGRRGKYLIFELSDEVYLIVHLRMTGTLLLDPPSRPAAHARASSTSATTSCVFVDPRRFGTGELALGARRARRVLRRAPRPRAVRRRASPPRTCTRSRAAAARRSRRSCSTSAGSPASATSTPTRRCSAPASTRCGRPGPLKRAQLRRAARRGHRRRCRPASTPRARRSTTSATPYGVQGSFQDQFLVHLREGEPCPSCGTRDRSSCAPRGGGPTSARAASRCRGAARRPLRARERAGAVGARELLEAADRSRRR